VTEKERQLTDGRGVGGGGAESYDVEKSLSSINNSILSAYKQLVSLEKGYCISLLQNSTNARVHREKNGEILVPYKEFLKVTFCEIIGVKIIN
jgi:hypothetical protein